MHLSSISKVYLGRFTEAQMRSFSFGLLFFLTAFSTNAFCKGYIIGGQEVSPSDPIGQSTVGIFEPSPAGDSGSLCSGTLIRKDMVLTAAHCIQPGGPKPMVIFGSDLHSPDSVRRQAEGVAVNPEWQVRAGKGMDQGDIALVRFPGGMPDGFHKIASSESDADLQPGGEVTLAGFGINNASTKTGAGRLRKANVQIVDSRKGKSEMILDQSRGRGACHGDSGGPAYINRNGKTVLAGVTNRGYPDHAPDDCAHRVVYTKVPAYKSWIEKSVKNLEARKASSAPILMARNTSARSKLLAHKKMKLPNVAKLQAKLHRARHSLVRRLAKPKHRA
jgi:secreted trypsin-like serine protease